MRWYKRVRILLILILVLGGCGLNPTPPAPTPTYAPPISGPLLAPIELGVWNHYNVQDGLPYSSTTAVAVDSQGGIWVGTARGAAYFDGETWTAYGADQGLLGDLVLDIVVDGKGAVWFAGNQGVTRFFEGSWTHFTVQDGLQKGYVQVAALDQSGSIWFGVTGAGDDWAFGNGVARLDDLSTNPKTDDQWQLYPPTRDRMGGSLVSAVLDLGVAGFWFGTAPEGTGRVGGFEGGIWRLQGGETLTTQDDIWTFATELDAPLLPTGSVTALVQTNDGQVWLGTPEGLAVLSQMQAKDFDFSNLKVYTVNNGLPSNRVLALAARPDGTVWVGTDAGLGVIEDQVVWTITRSEGLPDNVIRDITFGLDGSVWVATPSGISMFREEEG